MPGGDAAAKPGRAGTPARVLEVVGQQLREMSSFRALQGLSLDSSLERDLGLDSLSRAELIIRIEKEFGVSLPDSAIMDGLTPRDLAEAVLRSPGRLRGPERGTTVSGPPGPGETRVAPESAGTLLQILEFRAHSSPDRPHIYLREEDDTEKAITFSDLAAGAREVAAGLCKAGLKSGETVALMLPTGEDFFHSFFGALLAGGIPVPIYPPLRPDRIEEYVRRQAAILENAGAAILVTFPRVRAVAHTFATIVPGLRRVDTCAALRKAGRGGASLPGPGNLPDTALIQYTSGSTGRPKGVVLSHGNLLANIRALGTAARLTARDVGVSWLPLYHDMGLIGAWLGALYHGIPVAVMSPLAFIARPQRWLWAIHSHRATITAAPNFAYELCARRLPDEALEGLDLSCLRVMFNGAEPVSPETLERFARRFAPCGFDPRVLAPVYGLAENSLCLTCPPPGRGPRVETVSRRAFGREGRALPAGEEQGMRFVSCGMPLPGHEVRLLDERGAAINSERVIGRLEFRGPSASAGYFRSPPGQPPLVREGWLDSGDLAYQAEGEIFITGRSKDLIIRGGRNLAPQELEEVAGEVKGVRAGCVAAFGVMDEAAGTEQVVIVAETRETADQARERIRAEITAAVTDAAGVPPDIVMLPGPGSVPKTSSGKISRSACRDAYLKGALGRRRAPAWLQLARLAIANILRRARKTAGAAIRLPFGLYVGLLLLASGIPLLAAVALLPLRPNSVRRSIAVWARWFLRLSAIRIRVEGIENLDPGACCVLVANHASYADALVLAASLPKDFIFLAKQELLGNWLIAPFIRRGRHLTVNRLDPGRGETARSVAGMLEKGTSVLIFPEGTFSRATGLRPFALGAFKVAADAGCPVCPVALSGTRRILRGESLLPRPGLVRVVVGEPIRPAGQGWREAVRLRDLAKDRIARACGEPVLDLTEAGIPAT